MSKNSKSNRLSDIQEAQSLGNRETVRDKVDIEIFRNLDLGDVAHLSEEEQTLIRNHRMGKIFEEKLMKGETKDVGESSSEEESVAKDSLEVLDVPFTVTKDYLDNKHHLNLIGGKEKMDALKSQVFTWSANEVGLDLKGDLEDQESQLYDLPSQSDGGKLYRQLEAEGFPRGYRDLDGDLSWKDEFRLSVPFTRKGESFVLNVDGYGRKWDRGSDRSKFPRFVPLQ